MPLRRSVSCELPALRPSGSVQKMSLVLEAPNPQKFKAQREAHFKEQQLPP